MIDTFWVLKDIIDLKLGYKKLWIEPMIFKADSKNSQNQTVTNNIFKDSNSTDYFSLYILNLFFIYSL